MNDGVELWGKTENLDYLSQYRLITYIFRVVSFSFTKITTRRKTMECHKCNSKVKKYQYCPRCGTKVERVKKEPQNDKKGIIDSPFITLILVFSLAVLISVIIIPNPKKVKMENILEIADVEANKLLIGNPGLAFDKYIKAYQEDSDSLFKFAYQLALMDEPILSTLFIDKVIPLVRFEESINFYRLKLDNAVAQEDYYKIVEAFRDLKDLNELTTESYYLLMIARLNLKYDSEGLTLAKITFFDSLKQESEENLPLQYLRRYLQDVERDRINAFHDRSSRIITLFLGLKNISDDDIKSIVSEIIEEDNLKKVLLLRYGLNQNRITIGMKEINSFLDNRSDVFDMELILNNNQFCIKSTKQFSYRSSFDLDNTNYEIFDYSPSYAPSTPICTSLKESFNYSREYDFTFKDLDNSRVDLFLKKKIFMINDLEEIPTKSNAEIVVVSNELEISIDDLKGFESLEYLFLGKAKITGDFNQLENSNLKSLYVKNSEANIDVAFIKSSKSLRELSVQRSNLQWKITDEKLFENLTFLDLYDNPVSFDLDILPKTLKNLQLGNTDVYGDISVFSQFNSLDVLGLSNTKVTGSSKVFIELPQIRFIDLSSTNVEIYFDDFYASKKLQYLIYGDDTLLYLYEIKKNAKEGISANEN